MFRMPDFRAEGGRMLRPGRIAAAVGVVLTANLLLAGVSFLKDAAYATYFGTTPWADVFTIAFFLPDTLGSNLLAAALGVVCVPLFAEMAAKGEMHRLRAVYRALIRWMLWVVPLFMLGTLLVGGWWIKQSSPGFGEVPQQSGWLLLLVLSPLLAILPMTAVWSAMLQAGGRFAEAAYAPVVLNGVWLAGAAVLLALGVPMAKGSLLMAASVTSGALTAGLTLWLPLRRLYFAGTKPAAGLQQTDILPALKRLGREMIPYTAFLLGSQGVLLAERLLASKMEAGALSGLHYAYRLSQFPNWVFTAAVMTVFLPEMSKSRIQGDQTRLRSQLIKALAAVWAVSVPAAAGLYFFREPVIRLLLMRGAFDEGSVQVTASILGGYALAIAGQVTASVCLRFALVLGKPWPPILACLGTAGLTVWCDLLWKDALGPAALGYGAAVGALVNLALQLGLVRRLWSSVKEETA